MNPEVKASVATVATVFAILLVLLCFWFPQEIWALTGPTVIILLPYLEGLGTVLGLILCGIVIMATVLWIWTGWLYLFKISKPDDDSR